MTSSGRVLYPCNRCGVSIDARTVHVKTIRHVETERATASGRRVITVQASEVLTVTHLAPCRPTPDPRSS